MRRRPSQPAELDQPAKYLKRNTFVEEIDGKSYFYFIAGKRNNTGLLFNDRFFLVVGDEKVGYARECGSEVKLPLRNRAKIPQLKNSVKIKDVTKCQEVDPLTILIAFSLDAVELDAPPYWILKFETVDVAQSVFQRLQEARNKSAMLARGVQGMYDGANGISAFKKQVEGDLHNIVYDKAKSNIEVRQPEPIAPIHTVQSMVEQPRTSSLIRGAENPETSFGVPNKSQQISPTKSDSPQPVLSIEQLPQESLIQPPVPIWESHKRSYHWLERILLQSSYLDTIEQFNGVCMRLVVDLVDKEQHTHLNHHELLKQHGVSLCFEKYSSNSPASNKLRNEFANYKYLLARTNNEGRVKAPLVALIEYRGWLALAKLVVPGQPLQTAASKQLLGEVADRTRADVQHLYVVQLNNSYFDMKGINLPKYYFLVELPRLLLTDPLLHSSLQHPITPECMMSLCEQNQYHFSSTELTKQHLQLKFDTLLKKLDEDEEEVYSYAEILSVLQAHQLSKEYLPALYKRCNSNFLKQYLWTALCAQQIYQRCLDELSANSSTSLVAKLNDIISMKGDLWQEVCVQLQRQHQLTNPRKDLNRAQLAHFLIEMFGLVVDEKVVGDRLAQPDTHEILNHSKVVFCSRMEDIRMYNSAKWQRVALVIQLEYTQSAHEDLVWLLKLNDNPSQINSWPENSLFNKLRLCLVNFAAPPEIQGKSPAYSEELYRSTKNHKPSLWKWKLTVTRIKWLLMEKQAELAVALFEELLASVNHWSNSKHPILYELLSMMGRFYVMQKDYPKGAEYLEKARQLHQTLRPDDLTELVNISTEIASAYEKSKNIKAALRNNVGIATQLDQMELSTDEIYAVVQCRIAKQALFMDNFNLAKEAAMKSVGVYYELNSTHAHQGSIVECYQLLSRIAELSDKGLYESICENCGKGLGELTQPENVERMLRIVLVPYFSQLPKKRKDMLIDLIQSLPKLTNGYNRAYSYLSRQIKQGSFIELLQMCIGSCQQLCLEVQQQGLLDTWRQLQEQAIDGTDASDLVCLLQALSNFVGMHYLTGCLC